MNTEKYNKLTYEIIKAIDYEFFNKDGYISHLKLKQEYSECFSDDEILRIKVVSAAINTLSEQNIVEVFEKVGLDSNDISTMKRIYDKPFKQGEE